MPDYFALDEAALTDEHGLLLARYQAYKDKGLRLDMSRGKPAADQLDLSMDMLAMADVIDDTGLDTRNYGNLEGCPEARRFFAELLGARPEETVVAGSSSLNLMYNLVDMAWRHGVSGGKPWREQPGAKFLCPTPGYDRHFRVAEEFGLELVSVAMTPAGPDMDEVERLAADPSVKGIWCIPVYSNPDGYVYSDETVRRLAEMKTGAEDFRIFWDNAYIVHSFSGPTAACPSLLAACQAAGNPDRAYMLCSTSKITFAGAGVSALAASTANLAAISAYFFPMTICFDKVNQLRHVRYLKKVGLANHMARHAALIGPKFSRVWEIFHRELDGCGAIARWTEPGGGYFFSLFVMEGCAKRVVELCREAGVVLTGAGAAFPYGIDPGDSHLRIAPTFPPVEELVTAAELLTVAVRLASVEMLMAR